MGDELENGSSRNPVVGTLGLRAGDALGNLFDYGDSHWFRVEVVALHKKAPRGTLPSVVKKVGKAIRQW